jgi:thymidine phosphorylase
MEGLGAGLGQLAFWGFIAAVVVGGMWYSIREKEAQHETLRRMVESGKPVDEEMLEKILGGTKDTARDLRVGGMITLAVAPGLAIMGLFISMIEERALYPLLGTAILVGCVGIGLLVAAKSTERSDRDVNSPPRL